MCVCVCVYSRLIHWYMACPNRYDTVRMAQTCRAYAQTMCKLCVNSSCQCGHSLAGIRVLVVNSS